MTRLPPLEHAFGRDRLARIHRFVGFLSSDLIVVHIVMIIAAYAGADWRIVPATTWHLSHLYAYPGVGLALPHQPWTGQELLQQPSGNPKDSEINSYALPILIEDTIDAQSAEIDMISGATVASDGYVQSLQSALDQAGI